MTVKDCNIYFLGKYGNEKTSVELTNLYFEYFPEKIEKIKEKHILDNNYKTEKELFNSFMGQVKKRIWDNPDLITTTLKNNKNYYTLTEEGMSYYINMIKDDTEEIDTENDDSNNEEELTGKIYLMKSETFENLYKIGKTSRPTNERLQELSKDYKYGVFGLKLVSEFTVNNYHHIEQNLLHFFQNFRICKKNGSSIDTELVKDCKNIEEDFESYIKMLKNNKRHKIKDYKKY